MQAKSFLIFNAVVVVLLVLRLIVGRRAERPTALDIKSSPSTKPSGERVLSCPFEFKDKTYDAFEVLGVPAGASRDECYRAYIDLSRQSGSANGLVGEAWKTLEKHFQFGGF